MKKVLRFRVVASVAFSLCIASATVRPAPTFFNTLVDFNGTNGAQPHYAPLVQGLDGNLYGTTALGGAHEQGTVFKITPTGMLTTLYSFCAQNRCIDGAEPLAGLMLATDGNFYGTTYSGGTGNFGTIFKITPVGTLTPLHSFRGADGAHPNGGLIQGTDGNFYGTTFFGGTDNLGTVFEITPQGTITTLYRFKFTDGAYPRAPLIQGTDGNFYGTTTGGGAYGNYGTIFEITPAGMLTVLYSFCAQTNCTDGYYVSGAVVQGADGNFYGTTEFGGTNNFGTVFQLIYEGTLNTLYSFDEDDGVYPRAGLIQATDGNFYGTTTYGGVNSNFGTVFEITSGGTLTTLHSFDNHDGAQPRAALVQGTNGSFYGTTHGGGGTAPPSDGTIFRVRVVGIGAFVETLPTSGQVGAAILILGSNLTGATSVTFNGTAATFTVVSPTEIQTTVPSGATTGKVQVTTAGSTLTSNVPFTVE
jgi:uncharacterized repeat protein (TIGR03803 family)